MAAVIAVEYLDGGNDRVISCEKIRAVRLIAAVLKDERLWPIVAYRYKDLPLVGFFFKLVLIFSRIFMGVKLAGTIEPGFSIGHASCIFFNKNIVIGRDVRINQGVTIAGRGNGYPYLCDNVHVSAGAKILGPVRIGKNAHVGANAVVLHDVPDNSTVVGIPARLVRIDGKKINIPLSEYWKSAGEKQDD